MVRVVRQVMVIRILRRIGATGAFFLKLLVQSCGAVIANMKLTLQIRSGHVAVLFGKLPRLFKQRVGRLSDLTVGPGTARSSILSGTVDGLFCLPQK